MIREQREARPQMWESGRAVVKDAASIHQSGEDSMNAAGFALAVMLAAFMAFVALCEWGVL